MLRWLTPLLIALILTAAGGPAWAHAELVTASPRVGSTVPVPPSEVRLSFSEGVEPHFSGMEVTAADGHSVTAGRVQAQGAEMRVALARGLPPGTYRVTWHVVSVDTHRTQGSFTFEIRP
ncbi:copper homeostasis periplasmic binding protein CopC [Methylobacterium sp. WSM2598]|uniref:copper homeostasis periplasmic binding protein CopC n=1 Tax=Methylobacterium sp. WSM2598 TaxID=398261 RepID=UPI00036E8AC9|nr:copper homeostasis periplasmic binding protein CopC [Methylobacterium sp. WSM2598]